MTIDEAEADRLRSERDALRSDLAASRKVVSRIWDLFGNPEYVPGGPSIYDRVQAGIDAEAALPSERRARESAERANNIWQKNSRENFEALCAMRNSINEHIPMPSLESDFLTGPSSGAFAEAVATAVITYTTTAEAALAAERARVVALEEAIRAVQSATGAYLPPDGIDAKECISRVLAATGNPIINAAMGL